MTQRRGGSAAGHVGGGGVSDIGRVGAGEAGYRGGRVQGQQGVAQPTSSSLFDYADGE
jgi:hypothetical protein